MARFVPLEREGNKTIYVNPDYVISFGNYIDSTGKIDPDQCMLTLAENNGEKNNIHKVRVLLSPEDVKTALEAIDPDDHSDLVNKVAAMIQALK